ncbi:SMI1/KNR4 family protein [Shewanella sp. UCD-KL21]|uniref:SMI1/KNR4 family protein n=1 Tax=Shewanella sp. UCD-KL21 TaxID=1917164 RepID=UPI000970B744|nr:SMI1/KNR4 family protein [Shewanella sp. UCD-KL21]
MEYCKVVENWKLFADAVKKLGGEASVLSIHEPATEAELTIVESKIGCQIPPSLKEVLINFSKKVEFRWFMPDDYEFESPLSEIFSGDRHWSLEWLIQFNEEKNGWKDEVFPNIEDPYDAVWHGKFAFQEVGNGDYLAIDISQAGKEPVVYLSHDDGDGHGIEIAKNFKEFLFLSSRLGCVGAEDWQWLPFVEESQAYINPDCENAKKFMLALGVKA